MNREIQQLLPFYLNGTLSDEECQRVEEALKKTPEMQQELALLKQIQEEVKSQAFESSPGELGLKRLQREITRKTDLKPAQPATNHRNRIWQFVAAAACLVVVLQSGYMLNQPRDDSLTPAGGTLSTQPIASLAVTFVPEAQEQDIRALLLSVNATLVDGPTTLGVYRLAVRGDKQKALLRLQAQTSLIESVQIESTGH